MSSQLQNLRVLMIGNSFSICVGRNLPQIVAGDPTANIELTSAYIGGCPFERHWNNVLETESNPDAKQYGVITWATLANGIAVLESRSSINELIKRADWDIITIQQASHESWKTTSYEPFASNLIDYIRKHSPRSKIMIQQTWAYRADDPRIMPGGAWGFDQTGMYERLTRQYTELSRTHGDLEIIPTGLAVQTFRSRVAEPFVPYTTEQLATYKNPDLPRQCGDIVGAFNYWHNAETGELSLGADQIHLNFRGEYMQACVWYLSLYGRDSFPENIWVNPKISVSEAKELQACALHAVKTGIK